VSATPQTQFKNVDPPFWVAWNQAKASIRVRFLRMMITALGIALGIAFFSSMMAMRAGKTDMGNQSQSQMTWLVATSLVMCLVGVTNSMLMSVTERFREIGTIKCLGASDGFIVKVFFLEALLLGAIGSFFGATVGSLLMTLYLALQHGAPSLSDVAGVALLGTGVGCLMTVIAAIAPAIQASKMPAAAALRVEI
jgi:ABC-type antimicrobial peptide transport system permease subunit